MYQFPMGKVKFQKKREDPQEEKVYQFPMGKVKPKWLNIVYWTVRINSLWER